MAINTMEEFLDLYLATRVDCGHLIFTGKYPDDFFAWISNKKYAELFSFFHSKEDLDFISYLKSHYEEASDIEIIHRDSGEDTIHFRPSFCYPIATTILGRFDNFLYNQMKDLIFDMERTKELNRKLQYYDAGGVYQVANPNGFYHLTPGERLYVDGSVSCLGDDTYLVEDSLFSVLESFDNERLKKVNVCCFYKQNKDYVDRIVDRLVLNNHHNDFLDMKSAFAFDEVQKNKVYQYNP